MNAPQGLSFHNVVEFEPINGGGVGLFRIPRRVREALSPLGRMVAEDAAGVEVRFVTEAPAFRISLGSLPSFLSPYESHGQEVVIFRGPFVHSLHRIEPGRVNHIHITPWGGGGEVPLHVGEAKRRGFSPNVWRVFLGRCARIFHGLETFGHSYRAPLAEELPPCRWLAYGSSITNGAAPASHLSSYIYHAARAADCDVLNLGLSGSCECEREIADYLGGRVDYDLATLEVGVNMRQSVPPKEFRERVEYLLDAVTAHQTPRRIFLITPYPNFSMPGMAEAQSEFSTILRELAGSGRWPSVRLVEGSEILDDPGDLSADYIHPSDYGHARMGVNLGRILCEAK